MPRDTSEFQRAGMLLAIIVFVAKLLDCVLVKLKYPLGLGDPFLVNSAF
jgi:hypothetical protein